MQKSRRAINRALSWRLRAFYLHPSWYAGDTVPSQQPLLVPKVYSTEDAFLMRRQQSPYALNRPYVSLVKCSVGWAGHALLDKLIKG